MATKTVGSSGIPKGSVPLKGSERRPAAGAKRLGDANPDDTLTVTITLRRRPDGAALPTHETFLNTHPAQRQRMPSADFARLYGASPSDIDTVRDFASRAGLTLVESNAARRTVVVKGTVDKMNAAFGVDLGRYEHVVKRSLTSTPRRETYRGRDGAIYVPAALEPIVVGVFGLDNRSIGGRNGAKPPHTTTVSLPTVSQLYNYPPNSAMGQTIGIFSEDGYSATDISTFFASLPAGYTAPTVTDVLIGSATNSGSDPEGEITQDIDIAAAFAPGAAISVYLNGGGQQGWVDTLSRVAHPDAGDAACSVFSSSWYIANSDDANAMQSSGLSVAFINAVSAALQDAAIQGVTVCIASGDTGSDSKIGDGSAHVQYPGSDPWVLSVGGTTVGNINGTSFDEYVWNDSDNGATGGGISAYFAVPSYQSNANVPASLNDSSWHGRGVPDVAGNANPSSGYSGLVVGGNSDIGRGTSASAPQWAGLVAVMNAALGVNLGFVNPAIYALRGNGFRDIVGSPGPADNGFNGTTGYPAGAGWDACTGWGSPNGQDLLAGLRSIYARTLYFIVDKSTYGLDEVTDAISSGGGLYSSAFWLVLEGFSISQLGGAVPNLGGAFKNLSGVSIFVDAAGPQYQYPGDLYTPQRIRFPYNIIFSAAALSSDFPAAGADPVEALLTAQISVATTSLAAEAQFELVSGADPYFVNVDPVNHQDFYLSQDLRVFSVAAGESPLPGAPAMTTNPYQSLQDLLGFLNGTVAYTTPGPDLLNGLPGQNTYETGDSSVTPRNGAGNQNFNFAIARVRLQGPALSAANNARVFFRLFVTQSCDTDFQPGTTYKSQMGTGTEANRPVFPLASDAGLTDPDGSSLQTMPFFASDASGTHDYDGTLANGNIRTITIPAGHDKVWAYYGCFLDVYDAGNQSKFAGTHHCLVAEIAYDDAPIINAGGVTLSPENTDKLAQRNLQITSSGNPSYPDTHRIPQSFDARPSRPTAITGELQDMPDELMIDWGNVPTGSTAHIYWPQALAVDLIALAEKFYGSTTLTASDAHTISFKTSAGIAYVPIPFGTTNFAGLLTLDLPQGIHVGQEFNVKVRRVASRRADTRIAIVTKGLNNAANPTSPPSQNTRDRGTKPLLSRNWRYVTGTFQVKIPVAGDAKLLPAEERTLAILKWRLKHCAPSSRWRPVLERYVGYVATRVDGFGGNSGAIQPSLTGGAPVRPARPIEGSEAGCRHLERPCWTGKISALRFDHFGDFQGFWLEDTRTEEFWFASTEEEIEELARRAWEQRILVRVCCEPDAPHKIHELSYRRAPRTLRRRNEG